MVGTVQCRPSSGSAEVAIKKKYSEACQNVSSSNGQRHWAYFWKNWESRGGKVHH